MSDDAASDAAFLLRIAQDLEWASLWSEQDDTPTLRARTEDAKRLRAIAAQTDPARSTLVHVPVPS